MTLEYRISSFKGRRLDRTQPVKVHRNLHKKCYSLSQRGQVVAHAPLLALGAAKFIVSAAGWRRSIKQGRRNVHAFVLGRLRRSLRVSRNVPAYYSRSAGQFEEILTGKPVEKASAVLLGPRGMWFAP